MLLRVQTRPKCPRSAEEIRGHIEAGYQAIYDADLKSYFDTIPHDKLMICVGQRIADRMVLQLIRKWLKSPVIEMPKEGGGQAKSKPKQQRHTAGRSNFPAACQPVSALL